MDIRSLRYFVAVADANSFSRAAEAVGVVQSAISHQIRTLEEECGVALFVREGRSISLSPAGEALLVDARRILQMVSRSKERLTQMVSGDSGALRIGFQSAVCRRRIVTESLHVLRARSPDIDLSLSPMTGLAMEDALRKGELDGGFFYFVGASDLSQRRLYVDNWVLALPRNHRLAAARKLRLRELQAEEFIWLPRRVTPILYDRMLAACSAGGLTPHIVQEAFDEPMVLNLVAVGLGIAFVLDSAPAEADGNIVLKRVADFDVPTELCFVWNPDNANPVLSRFLRIVAEISAQPEPARASAN